jgi:4-amino-4-deoxy-L-arabinose transferase-like glycosyltransferase
MLDRVKRILRTDTVLLAGILVLVRVVFLLDAADGPLFSDLIMDERVHWDWAGTILARGALDEAFFRAPLYLYVLAAFRLLSSDGVFLCRLLGSLAGVGCALLIFRLILGLTDRRPWAWIAALLYGVCPEILFFDTRLLSDQLAAFLMTLALYLVVKGRGPVAVGVVIGLATVTRPLAIILLPLAAPWFWLENRELRSTLRRAVVLGACFLAIVAPVTVVNYLKSHDFVLVAWNGGVNFFIGNNPGSDGMTAVHPEFRKDWWGSYHDFINHAERELGRELKPSEISGYWYRQGLEFIVDDPGGFLGLLGRKAWLYVTGVEISNNIAITPYLEDATPVFARLPNRLRLFMVFLPVGLLALWTRRFHTTPALLALYTVAYAAVNILFFVTSRYRLPAIPALVVLGAHALWLIRSEGRKQWPRIVVLVVSVPLVWAFHVPINVPGYHVAVGNLWLQKGDPDRAERHFRDAAEAAPRYPQVAEGFAMVAESRGRPARAIPLYEQEVEVSGSVYARYRLAALYYDARRFSLAYRHSAVIPGHFEDASILHAKICIELERYDEAVRTLRANLDRGAAVEDSEYLLATVFLLQGRPEAAAILDKHRQNPKFDRLRELRELLARQRSSTSSSR